MEDSYYSARYLRCLGGPAKGEGCATLGKRWKNFIFYKNKNEQGEIRNFVGFPFSAFKFYYYFYFEVGSLEA